MHVTSTYYTTYFFLNFPEKCTYYKNGVEYMLNDGHGIFGVIFFLRRVGSTSHFCLFLQKKESLLHRSTDKISRHAVMYLL